MGKSSLTIAISGSFNGNALKKAEQSLKNMQTVAASTAGGVAGGLAKVGGAAAELGGKIYNAGAKMESVGQAATRNVTLPLAAAGAACYAMSTEFENSMAKVATIADTTEVPMDELRGAIIDLSNDTGIAASDIADNVYNAISAGQKTGDAVAFVGDAAKLAKAGFTDSASALDVLTTTMNAYKMEADQTTRISDVLLMTQNKGKTTVGELASSMGRAIPTASAFGVNLENLAAAYATTTASGIATAESTTYINSMIKELGDTGSDVGTILKEQTGKSFSELMADGMSLGDALNIVSSKGAETGKTMYDMFGSAEAASAAATIASDGASQFTENLGAMNGAAGSTDEAFGKMETTTYTVEKAVNKVKNVLVETGDTLVKNLSPAIDGFADGAQEFAEWFDSLDEGARDMIVQAAGMAAAFGPVVTVLGKTTKGVGNLLVAFGRCAQGASRFVSGTNQMTTEAAKAATSANGLAKGAEAAGKGANVASAGMRALNGACKATAIGLAVTLVADLVGQLSAYAEHQGLVEDATNGMVDAMGAADAAYQAYTPSVEASTEAIENNTVSAEDCLRSQADLAKTMNDTWADCGTNAAMVDDYARTIQELGNKGELSATEQERLKAAVEGFNDITGSSVGIINSQTGELSMQKDAILEVAEAYKTEARAEAARELYKETTKQLIQDQISLKQATEELAGAEEGWGIWLGDFPVIADEASLKHHELQANVDDLTAATESAEKTQSDLLNVMAGSQASFSTLDQALEATGINMSDFGSIGDAELSALQENFDGTLNSIVSTCAEQGVQIPSALADSIRSNSGLPADAQQVMFDALVLKMTGGDVERAAKALGHDIDQGLVDGITGSADMPQEAVGILSDDVIDRAKSAFESHSPSQVMHRLGTDIDSGLTNGITDNSEQPATAMETLATMMKDAVSGLPGFSKETGSSSGSNLASSIGSFAGSVLTSGLSLFASAKNGVSGTPDAYSGIGSQSGSNLAAKLGAYHGAVGGSASSLRGAAVNPLSDVPGMAGGYGNEASKQYAGGLGGYLWKARNAGSELYSAGARMQISGAYQWGSEAGHSYANGLMSAVSAAANAAMSIARAAASAIHFSRPDVGPLRYVDEYGAEMVDVWTGGMLANEGAVRDASAQLARAVDMGREQAAVKAQSEAMGRAIDLSPMVGAYKAKPALRSGETASGGNSYNYYTIGDITLDISSIKEFVTIEQLFDFLRRAKANNMTKARA